MKKILLVLIFLIAGSAVSAQNFRGRGLSLGADRDTLLYIIASPFDNWFLNFSGGVQTFIGNTPDPQAAWNRCDYGIRAEIGKWLIPDMALSLRFGLAGMHSRSRFGGNNPWSDVSNPINYEGAQYGPYYPIKATTFYAMGIVTFDWTNFLKGYEAGKRKHWHFYTPVGLGGMFNFGEIVNPNYVNKVNSNADEVSVELGDIARNKELAFTGGIMTEYYATKHLSINAALELLWARGSIDDYNYNLDMANQRNADFVPSFYVGAKINLFKDVMKYNPYTKDSYKDKVNHEFLTFGTRSTVPTLTGRIDRLNKQIDSVLNLADALRENQDDVDDLIGERDSLQQRLDSLYNDSRQPRNVMEELINANDILQLPSTVVYFELDRYNLDYNGRRKLQQFTKEMAALPDTLEFLVVGAADSLTGSIRHNQWLSKKRCNTAITYLVDEYGADPNQLVVVPVGGITTYDPKELNRMVLVILRTKEIEDIINRWVEKSNSMRP